MQEDSSQIVKDVGCLSDGNAKEENNKKIESSPNRDVNKTTTESKKKENGSGRLW